MFLPLQPIAWREKIVQLLTQRLEWFSLAPWTSCSNSWRQSLKSLSKSSIVMMCMSKRSPNNISMPSNQNTSNSLGNGWPFTTLSKQIVCSNLMPKRYWWYCYVSIISKVYDMIFSCSNWVWIVRMVFGMSSSVSLDNTKMISWHNLG
jgi:hypothetical protein